MHHEEKVEFFLLEVFVEEREKTRGGEGRASEASSSQGTLENTLA